MKRALWYTAGFIGLTIGSFTTTPLAQTTAAGPYYATPSWDQQLPASTRFIVLSNWGSAAVLDRETGLVWERSPSTSAFSWEAAQVHCNFLTTGGRLGWRLPTLQELASLVDPSVLPPGPTLPSGHPFSDVQSSFYWSATTFATNSTIAWDVFFATGNPGFSSVKSETLFGWCVRGGQGVDPQ
jgi:hypothetical protein